MTPDQPILQLAPHELAPNRRADFDGEPFEFRASWSGVERDFIGQIVGQDMLMIFFRLADEPEIGNFVVAQVLQSKYKEKLSKVTWAPRTEIPIEGMEQLIARSAENLWGRRFYLDDNLNVVAPDLVSWRLFLGQDGHGQWSGAPDYWSHAMCFGWHDEPQKARQLSVLPPLELLSQVRQSLLDSQSDASHARVRVVENRGAQPKMSPDFAR